MSDGFTTLAETLAGLGHTLEARTRLAFGREVAAALANIESGGFVVVATQGTTDEYVAGVNALVNENIGKVALVDARTHEYTRVRPNVATYLKSRKIGAGVTPPRKDDDGNAIGFVVRKSTK